MEVPPEISFRNVDVSERQRDTIDEEIAKLERYYDRIIRCRVVVEMPHRHSDQGNLYHVGIRLTVPTKELVVSRDPADEQSHRDLEVAIKDAFRAMRRQLEDHTREMRSEQKGHPQLQFGKVARLMSEDRYGFIRTPDGREIYFHEDALVGADLDDLQAADRVRFVEGEGEKGPLAEQVHVLTTDPLPVGEEG